MYMKYEKLFCLHKNYIVRQSETASIKAASIYEWTDEWAN